MRAGRREPINVVVVGKVLWPDCNLAVKGFLHVQLPGRRLLGQGPAIVLRRACARRGGHLQLLAPTLKRSWELEYLTARVVAAVATPLREIEEEEVSEQKVGSL